MENTVNQSLQLIPVEIIKTAVRIVSPKKDHRGDIELIKNLLFA